MNEFTPSRRGELVTASIEAVSRMASVDVPDEVVAALSGMMEQLSAIGAAPTDAERERQYDVLAGMLAAATACAGSSSATSHGPPLPGEGAARATATHGGPAVSQEAFEDLGGDGGAEEFDDDEDARFALHCAAPQSPRPEHCDPLGSEPAAGAEAESSPSTQRQAPPAAEVTDEEAAKAAWVAEAEVEWAADVEEHARRREEAEVKAEAARVKRRAEAAATRARLEEELADVPAGMLNCVLKTYALEQ